MTYVLQKVHEILQVGVWRRKPFGKPGIFDFTSLTKLYQAINNPYGPFRRSYDLVKMQAEQVRHTFNTYTYVISRLRSGSSIYDAVSEERPPQQAWHVRVLTPFRLSKQPS